MSTSESGRGAARTRREPPPYRQVTVRRTEPLTPHMTRFTFAGPDLDGFTLDEPAASVRLLVPSGGGRELVMPTWNGNEFLLPDGERPGIRTFTPRRFDAEQRELDLDVVLHEEGVASDWARRAQPGDEAAISGPGRGYTVDPGAAGYVLAGDETAVPAIGQLLEVLPPEIGVEVHVEVARPDARLALPEHPRARVTWHDLDPGGAPGETLLPAVRATEIGAGTRVWAAGEAASVQGIRRHLFQERGLDRSQAAVRGYWKHGRRGT